MKALNAIEMNKNIYQDYDLFDDVSDRLLDKELAIKARRLEIDLFKKKQVFDKVQRSQASGEKIISTRSIDINTSDSERPDYRSRLVGREFKLLDQTDSQRHRHWSRSGYYARYALQISTGVNRIGCLPLTSSERIVTLKRAGRYLWRYQQKIGNLATRTKWQR